MSEIMNWYCHHHACDVTTTFFLFILHPELIVNGNIEWSHFGGKEQITWYI